MDVFLELRVFIGILIVTGYNSSGSSDLRNGMVYKAMRRNRFEEINYRLHFELSLCKPNVEGTDKLWKLRALTDHIKVKMLENFHPEQNLSYDESIIAYFERHGCKQFIKGKPIRFGYKAWSLCTPSGYMISFEIYQDPKYEERFGTCAAPLLRMIDDFSEEVKKLPFGFFSTTFLLGFRCFLIWEVEVIAPLGQFEKIEYLRVARFHTKMIYEKNLEAFMKV